MLGVVREEEEQTGVIRRMVNGIVCRAVRGSLLEEATCERRLEENFSRIR